jgi:hypothetical protein
MCCDDLIRCVVRCALANHRKQREAAEAADRERQRMAAELLKQYYARMAAELAKREEEVGCGYVCVALQFDHAWVVMSDE